MKQRKEVGAGALRALRALAWRPLLSLNAFNFSLYWWCIIIKLVSNYCCPSANSELIIMNHLEWFELSLTSSKWKNHNRSTVHLPTCVYYLIEHFLVCLHFLYLYKFVNLLVSVEIYTFLYKCQQSKFHSIAICKHNNYF